MYKLFLCLRYLRRRVIAIFAMAGVTLCVAMMIIVTSVMNGFLDKIERAAKGLFGDIVIEARSQEGIAAYDELIGAIRRDVPEVEAGSPFILSIGFLQIPYQPAIRKPLQIAGIRLPERVAVTDFAKGLFVQQGLAAPTFDPPVDLMLRRIAEESSRTEALSRREEARAGKDGRLPPDAEEMLDRLSTALHFQQDGARNLTHAADNRGLLGEVEAQRRLADANGDTALVQQLNREVLRLQSRTYEPPEDRVILGLGIPGLSIRTDQGQTIRIIGPGSKIVLNIFPLGRAFSGTDITPNTRRFSVVDDYRSDVWSIDSDIVYVPFDTLQVLNNMDQPPRCSQVHLKVNSTVVGETRLRAVAVKVENAWLKLRKADPNASTDLEVRTWRQRQEAVVAPIAAQRTLVMTMFGVISMVAVVLIFVIFYMIVLQKTKEIGVMKAVGASGWGVATIFLAYGAAVGLVGAIAGTALGQEFVHNINPIQDWIAEHFGFRVWNPKNFMFGTIPNTVDWGATVYIVIGSILAGLVGALIPAIRAARMQPVEALRYE